MFLPNDPCLYKGEPLTVVRYLDRRTVETVADTGEVRAYPEHKLHRPIRLEGPPRLSDLEMGAKYERISQRDEAFEEAFKSFLLEAPLNWNGHFQRGKLWEDSGWFAPADKRREEVFQYNWALWSLCMASSEVSRAVLNAYQTGEALPEYHTVSLGYGARHYRCGCCEGKYGFETNGVEIRVDAPCPYPDGLVSEATLNVPSGKMIVRDSLQRLNPLPLVHDINGTWGQHLRYLAHAKMGEILGQVGNTCPRVIRLADGTYQIGKFQQKVWYDADNNPCDTRPEGAGDYDYEYDACLPEGAEEVASVCTDVWAYAFMDYDDAERRASKLGVNFPPEGAEVVEVVPGTYQFRHFNNVNQRPAYWVAGTFERVGPATEAEDFGAKWLNMKVTPGQAVTYMARTWPTLYGQKEWEHACLAVLISAFGGCVPDRDWHPSGFKNDFMPGIVDDIEDREIPRLRVHTQHSFSTSTCLETTVSRKDKYFGGDVPLCPTWAKAALRVLENQISFGVHPRKHEGKYDWTRVRGEMTSLVKTFQGVLERYPDAGEGIEDFTEWLDDEVAVKRWISNYGKGL